MELEQNETFTITGPQLEVLGELEGRLPAPARRRPAAAGFFAVMVLLSVFGIGGARLKARRSEVMSLYLSGATAHGNSIQNDFSTQLDNAANLLRACRKVLGESDGTCAAVADLIARWDDTDTAPAAQYEVIHALDSAVDVMYNAAKAQANGDALEQIEGLDANYVSTQSILQREIAQSYTPAAQEYNALAASFPASLIGAVRGAGPVELYAAQ